jgi:hypothetical protein
MATFLPECCMYCGGSCPRPIGIGLDYYDGTHE